MVPLFQAKIIFKMIILCATIIAVALWVFNRPSIADLLAAALELDLARHHNNKDKIFLDSDEALKILVFLSEDNDKELNLGIKESNCDFTDTLTRPTTSLQRWTTNIRHDVF